MAILKKQEILKLIKELKKLYPNAECALNYKNVFQLLVAVMLSAQTTDKSVNKVTPILFATYSDAASIALMGQDELEEILRQIGMYRTKAKNLRAMCNILVKEYGGKVPDDYDKLVALPGVGRKTANVVLSVGFGHQRIAVDTHVFRLANRIGLTEEKNVLKTEMALMKIIPKEHWTNMHHALIWHGRQVCNARNPKCNECGISEWCKKNGVD
ncbi:MAG: endonuclease III [Anaerovoracaceae bacterium]|jgi:endonuclease-3